MDFDLLTKAQHAVMDVLCTMKQGTMSAVDIKPATLGSLCAMALVDVEDGQVKPRYIFQWKMAFHPEMFVNPTDACAANIRELLAAGMRIAGIKALRTNTDMDLRHAVEWMNYHYPRS